LAGEVLGQAGDQAVLAYDDDDGAGLEDEAMQIRPVDAGLPSLPRDGALHLGEGLVAELLPLIEHREALAPGAQKETGVLAGAVPLQQLLVVRRPLDHDGSGDFAPEAVCGGHGSALRPSRSAPGHRLGLGETRRARLHQLQQHRPSSSWLTLRCSILLSLPASSRAARLAITDGGSCR